jgi:hypothetical protein
MPSWENALFNPASRKEEKSLGDKSYKNSWLEQVAFNKSSLLPRNDSKNTQTLQLFTINIITKSIFKSYWKCKAGRLIKR